MVDQCGEFSLGCPNKRSVHEIICANRSHGDAILSRQRDYFIDAVAGSDGVFVGSLKIIDPFDRIQSSGRSQREFLAPTITRKALETAALWGQEPALHDRYAHW